MLVCHAWTNVGNRGVCYVRALCRGICCPGIENNVGAVVRSQEYCRYCPSSFGVVGAVVIVLSALIVDTLLSSFVAVVPSLPSSDVVVMAEPPLLRERANVFIPLEHLHCGPRASSFRRLLISSVLCKCSTPLIVNFLQLLFRLILPCVLGSSAARTLGIEVLVM